jgi:hypothetical protein
MPNSLIVDKFPIFEIYQSMRPLLFTVIEDADLAYTPANCPSLGELAVQIGEWQQSYVDSFRTFKQDFEYRNPDPELRASKAKLLAWYAELDAELKKAIEALSEEQIQNQKVDKGGWEASLTWNLEIYKECLIIFYSKAWVYLKQMGKELPPYIVTWIS